MQGNDIRSVGSDAGPKVAAALSARTYGFSVRLAVALGTTMFRAFRAALGDPETGSTSAGLPAVGALWRPVGLGYRRQGFG